MQDLDEQEIGGNLTWTELGILPGGVKRGAPPWDGPPGGSPKQNFPVLVGGFFGMVFFKLFRFQVLPSHPTLIWMNQSIWGKPLWGEAWE